MIPTIDADHHHRHLRRLAHELASLRKAIPLAGRVSGGVQHSLMSAAAAVLAYLPTQALGLREGFWAAITAIAVTQTEFNATRSTARDQFVGASLGGIVGLAAISVAGTGLAVYAGAVILAMLACWVANVASASRLSGITATILLLVPHSGSAARMLLSRIFEVGWGVAIAVAVVWGSTRVMDGLRARNGSRVS